MTAAEPGQHLAKLCSGPPSHPTLLPNRWRKRTGKVLLNSPDGVAQKEDGALGVTLRVGVMLKGGRSLMKSRRVPWVEGVGIHPSANLLELLGVPWGCRST